jgi:hypothetical protein
MQQHDDLEMPPAGLEVVQVRQHVVAHSCMRYTSPMDLESMRMRLDLSRS